MTNPTLDAYQQVFGMACIVGRTAGYRGNTENLQLQLQFDLSFYLNNVPPVTVLGQDAPSKADPSVTPSLGNWNLAWGPAIFENTTHEFAANAVFVAQCDAVAFPGGPVMPVYAVAIAGTNPSSLYDWIDEDLAVSQVVNWTTYDPAHFKPAPYQDNLPFISEGTALGVSNILSLKAPATAAAPGTSLKEFLENVKPGPDTAVIFCGHSLAGALSPTVALYLKQQKSLDAFGLTLIYPTAGPTPGEANFAKLFNDTFPALPSGWQPQPRPYQNWNTMHWNTLDVIPHSWNNTSLKQVPTLYGPPQTDALLKELTGLVEGAMQRAGKSNTQYMPIRNASLPGIVQHCTASGNINVPPQSMGDFNAQMAIQHTRMYFGIPPCGSNPPVPGLILPEALPESSPLLVPGVVKM